MKTAVVMVLLLRRLVEGREDARFLSELPFSELLTQKRMAKGVDGPVASALVGAKEKTFYEEEYEDGEKGHMSKKYEHKMQDMLNTSIMALSYLAFGGYLLCMIASAVREKRRRYGMAYPSAGATSSNQFAQVLQHYSHRPSRPFIRFPTVTVHQGGRRRRRRFAGSPTSV